MSYDGWHSDYGHYEIGEELGENKQFTTYILHYQTYNNEFHAAYGNTTAFKNLDSAIERLESYRNIWRNHCEKRGWQFNEDKYFIEKRVTNKVISVKTEKLDY